LIADKEGKSVVFPSLWSAGENQSIDFPCYLFGEMLAKFIRFRFIISLKWPLMRAIFTSALSHSGVCHRRWMLPCFTQQHQEVNKRDACNHHK